ncbi:MAG: class I tRNA ligase family protein [Dysgonamonadaceae bacterium]|nr:class I tRNA ligase family protein [Dysgonamonadaceae bacterium]
MIKFLHPFMPFITEEIYQSLFPRNEGESIMNAEIRQQFFENVDNKVLDDFEAAKEIITHIRNIRASKNISPKERLTLQVNNGHNADYNEIIKKLANVGIAPLNPPSEGKQVPVEGDLGGKAGAVSFMVGICEYAVPVGNLINADEEIKKMEAEITRLEGFLKSVNTKLSNEKFVANAKPEVVENERKKQADTESKIKALRESIDGLKK